MKRRILIIDNDPQSRRLIEETAGREEEMKVVACTDNGARGLSLIKAAQPDVVIMDMILPGIDGFELMDTVLSDPSVWRKPRFLMTGASSDPQLVAQAMQCGASYYLIKPIRVSSLQLALRRLCFMENSVRLSDAEVPSRFLQNRPDMETGRLLRRLGIPMHLCGYQYLIESVAICLQDRNSLRMITKLIYPEVSRKYHCSPGQVERGIRHAIEVCWWNGNRPELDELFGGFEEEERKRPSNSEFIAVISQRIREQTGEFY